MLWAIPIGIVAGLLAGGRLGNLSGLRFRWGAVAVGGLLVQAVLFTPAGEALAGAFVPAIYLASTLAVFGAVLRNLRLPGLPLVALGSLSNLAAIVANGGSMPASAAALVAAGLETVDHANSVVLPNPALAPLTDVFAIPAGVPFANVFSVGDVLIFVGIAWLIAAAMRRPAAGRAHFSYVPPAEP
jgi:hypothetical protein